MNHLAHALLAGEEADLVLGGLMGDFVRGAPAPDLPAGVREGIRLHRAIDSYTDAHPQVCAARALFAPPWRRYAGIMLDVWFDHLLARDFARWHELPLEKFGHRLRGLLLETEALQPPRMRRFVAYMQARGIPESYSEIAVIDEVFAGLAGRLRRANPLAEARTALERREPALQHSFEIFFPELQRFARDRRAQVLPSP